MHRLFAWWLLSWMAVVMGADPCNFILKEPRGQITSPNFPNRYPVPISCQWVIEAPPDKVIAIYFTQFYMREGLRATEYTYHSPSVKMGKQEFGTISSDREPTYLVSNKPVLVLNFAVREANNIHMRVREYLLDVFGFNITYEFQSHNDSVRRDACLYHHCSFTGNCYANLDYTVYSCSCFAKYFGEECQYDNECGPLATKNTCLNGGTCRYYIGSTVQTCECPPGYDGARCEAKKIAKQIDCSGQGCNVTCAGNGCARDDRRTRYIVCLKLTNPKATTILSDRKKLDTFKKDMQYALLLLFKGRLEMIENITVLELRSSSVMTFHLLAMEADGKVLNSTLKHMLQLGKLGSFDIDPQFHEIQTEPGLRIAAMESSDPMPLAEGMELTLACMIEGSEEMRVQWFKDGHPVHVHTGHRSMFTTIVPKNSQNHYTALLGFDRMFNLDSGVFTCEVHDWGFVRNRSMSVVVLSAPQPQVTPMTIAVAPYTPVVVTCLSRDDPFGDFGYTWLKNGRILNPSIEQEIAEDIFPAGSRILVPKVIYSAVYSCIITSPTGSTRKDSIVTLIDTERSDFTCPAEDYLKVRWTLAAANTDNMQLCPTGYTGDVRRKCSFKGNEAVWDEPDFSGCFSNSFLGLKKKVESLRLGYLLSDTANLLSKLKRYLLSKKPKLHFSEGEPIVDVLQEIRDIPHADKGDQEGWTTFLDIASVLLEYPVLIRKEKKLLQLHNLLFNYAFHYADKSNGVNSQLFERKSLAVETCRFGDVQQSLKLPSKRQSASDKFSQSPIFQYDWMTDSIEIDVADTKPETGNSSAYIVAVFYKNLSSHLPQRFFSKIGLIDVEYQMISTLIGVKVKGDIREENFNIKVSFTSLNYDFSDKHVGWNISCGIAEINFGTLQFTTAPCHMILNTGNTTVCQCQRIGTYALLLTHFPPPVELEIELYFDIVAGSGCAICVFLLFITLALLISLWRKTHEMVTSLKIQVCVALLGAFGLFLSCLITPISEKLYSYIVSFIVLFLLTAFALQLCLALVVYIENVQLKNAQYSFNKISALGWAVPLMIVSATLAAQSVEGYALERWWLTMGSNFFYAYTSSILILYMFQVLLLIIVKTEIRSYRKISDFLQGKKSYFYNNRLSLLHRSLFLTSTLLFFSMMSILFVNFDDKIYEYLFAISSVLVGMVVLLSYTIFSEKSFNLCCLPENHKNTKDLSVSDKTSGDSFKSFLRPEIMDKSYSRKMSGTFGESRINRMYSQIEITSLSDSLQTEPSILSSNQHEYALMHPKLVDHPYEYGAYNTPFDTETDLAVTPDEGFIADSLETVAHCDTREENLISRDPPQQTINMTAV